MKMQNSSRLMVLTLSLELILSPVAMANSATTTSTTPNPTPKTSTGTDIALGVLQIGAGIIQQVNQSKYQDAKYYQDLAGLTQQQTPQVDKYFSGAKLSQLPGLTTYLANNKLNPNSLTCSTLPTTMHESEVEECRVGIMSTNALGVQGQIAKVTAYADQYMQIKKLYENYSATSNVSGQGFGVGCMKNALQILNGYFQYRMNELDKLVTNLEAINNQFKEASKSDLNAIEETTAVLEGKGELADKVKSTKPELFNFASKFGNPACNSMMSGESFNELGGLNAINKTLQEQLTTKSGKFSGDSYLANHASVVEDITKMADKVAKQVELNFTSIAAGKYDANTLFNVSSTHGLREALSNDLIADQQAAFQAKNQKLMTDLSTIQKEFGGKANELIAEITNPNSGAFESNLTALETSMKNECLAKAVDVESVISNTYDASTSNFANKNASSFLKDKLRQIIDNDKSSFSKKMTELQNIEKQYSSYYVKMQNSYEVQEVDANGNLVSKVVPASTRRTPSAYLADVIKSCEAQFKSNHLNNQLTGADAVKRLRSIHNEYKSLAKSHANDIRNDIRSKMIECSSGVDANNTGAQSCTPDLFNTSSKSFCANAALSCSKNMKACSEQAKQYVTELKTDRTARVNNYKKLVEKNKQDIVKIFDTALAQYMKEGEYLRGLFGVGFASPKDIKRDVEDGSKYLSSFQQATAGSPDGTLLLEDPEAYVKMFKENIEKLKASVKEQQSKIVGDNNNSLLAGHIKQTENNYKNVIRDAGKFAQSCQQKYDSYVQNMEKQQAEQQKQLSELGEKQSEFCGRFTSALNSNPSAACQEDFKDMMKIAAKMGDGRASSDVSNLSSYCATQGTSSENPLVLCDENPEKSNETNSLTKACATYMACGKKTDTGTGDNKVTESCSEEYIKDLKAMIVRNATSSSQKLVGETISSSFCAGANDSSNTMKALEVFGKTLGVSQAGAIRN